MFFLKFIFPLIILLTHLTSGHPPSASAASSLDEPEVPEKRDKLPICIIGGGISGLGLANLLKDRGYDNVIVFEKERRVGGKIRTYRQSPDQVHVEMGPLFFIQFCDSLRKYMKKFGLTPTPFDYGSNRWLLDPDTGETRPLPAMTDDEQKILEKSVQKFIQETAVYKNDFEFAYQNSSSTLFVPIATWLGQRNLTSLVPIFQFLITVQGYGALDDVPALYALKLVGKTLISFALSGGQNKKSTRWDDQSDDDSCEETASIFTLNEGLDVLATKMAENVRVHRDHEVVTVRRKKENRQCLAIDYNRGGSRKYVTCQKVIFAFPPLLSPLQKMMPDLSRQERDLLTQVKVHRYMSAAHHIPNGGLDHAIYFMANPPGAAEVVALVKQSSRKMENVYSSYSWIRGDFDSPASPQDLAKMDRKRNQTLSKMGANSSTLFRMSTSYFPHVDSESLKEGFYKKFQKLQGTKGIYYVTTLNSFETMKGALDAVEVFGAKYFPEK